jgi:hypothetical protein
MVTGLAVLLQNSDDLFVEGRGIRLRAFFRAARFVRRRLRSFLAVRNEGNGGDEKNEGR